MIDVSDYRKRLEDHLFTAGYTKLDEPMDTDEVFSVAMVPDGDDFDMNFWRPAIQGMLRAMEHVRMFYRLDVYYDDNVFCVAVSCGDNPRPRING